MEGFAKDSEEDPSLLEEGEVGLPRRAFARQWYVHFSCASDFLTPESVDPMCGSFSSLMTKKEWRFGGDRGKKRR